MSVDSLLDNLGALLDVARNVPLSNKVVVDADDIRNILDEIRLNMPEEITKARQIASERRDILNEAQGDADRLIAAAEARAKAMVEEHEITKRARESANEIMQNARVQASELMETTRREANDMMESSQKWSDDITSSASKYVDDILARSEELLSGSVTEVRRSRQQFKTKLADLKRGDSATYGDDL